MADKLKRFLLKTSLQIIDYEDIRDEVRDREWQEDLPTKLHHLVVAEARQSPADPHKEEHHTAHLAEEDSD